MNNNFLEALIKELEILKNAGANPSVREIIKLVVRTAAHKKVPLDVKLASLEMIMGKDGIDPDEVELLRDLREQYQN